VWAKNTANSQFCLYLSDAFAEDQRTVLEKSIKQLNRVSISVSFRVRVRFRVSFKVGLVLGLFLGLVLGLMPSSDIVLKSTVLSSSCVPYRVPQYFFT